MKVGTLKKKLAKVPQDLPVWFSSIHVDRKAAIGIWHSYDTENPRLYLRPAGGSESPTVAQFRERVRRAPNSYPVTDESGTFHFSTVEERDGKVVIS